MQAVIRLKKSVAYSPEGLWEAGTILEITTPSDLNFQSPTFNGALCEVRGHKHRKFFWHDEFEVVRPKLAGIRMVGAAHKSNGMRISGWCHAHIEGINAPKYYSEDHCPDSIVADLEARGYDCAEFKEAIKDGKNWGFSLTSK